MTGVVEQFRRTSLLTSAGSVKRTAPLCCRRVRNANGVSGIRLVELGGRPAVTERDGEGVDYGLPAHRPSGAAGPGRVQAAGDKVQALHRGLLGREVTACLDCAAVAGVQRFDGIS